MNFSFKHVGVPKLTTTVKDPVREDFPFFRKIMRHRLVQDKPSSTTERDKIKEQAK